MTIRKIQQSDYNTYMELVQEFYSSDAVLHPIPPQNIERTFAELVRSDTYISAFIIENESKIAGYALTARYFSQEAGGEVIWIDEIYLRPQHRGGGIGTQVFEQIFAQFPEAAAFRLEIEPDNVRAKKLYQRLGFKSLGYAQMLKQVR